MCVYVLYGRHCYNSTATRDNFSTTFNWIVYCNLCVCYPCYYDIICKRTPDTLIHTMMFIAFFFFCSRLWHRISWSENLFITTFETMCQKVYLLNLFMNLSSPYLSLSLSLSFHLYLLIFVDFICLFLFYSRFPVHKFFCCLHLDIVLLTWCFFFVLCLSAPTFLSVSPHHYCIFSN